MLTISLPYVCVRELFPKYLFDFVDHFFTVCLVLLTASLPFLLRPYRFIGFVDLTICFILFTASLQSVWSYSPPPYRLLGLVDRLLEPSQLSLQLVLLVLELLRLRLDGRHHSLEVLVLPLPFLGQRGLLLGQGVDLGTVLLWYLLQGLQRGGGGGGAGAGAGRGGGGGGGAG